RRRASGRAPLAGLEPARWGVRDPVMPRDPLAQDRSKHAPAVAEGLEIALAVDPLKLEARDLGHPHARLGGSKVDQRLDLEAVDVDIHQRQAATPEGVVAIAQVAVVRAVQQVRLTS